MSIMTAGMHVTVCRGKGKSCLFLYWESINICPYAKDISLFFAFDQGYYAVFSNSLAVLDTHLIKLAAYVSLCFRSINTCLRDLVKIPSPFYQLFMYFY